jgi:hypothetical protein
MTLLHWRDTWSVLLAGSLTLCAARGAAQTPDAACDPNDPKSCVQPLSVGQAAPFAGLLLTPRRAAKLGVMAGECQARVDLGVEREQELAQVKLQGLQQLRDNDKQAAQLQIDLLTRRMADLAPRWYEHPAFVAVLTGLTTVAVLALSVKTVQALK